MSGAYMHLTKTNRRFPDDTVQCALRMHDAKGLLVAVWTVVTGQGYAQVFRKAGRNIPGSMEPLPQGDYVVHDIDWAGKKDDWTASHGPGIGPVFVPVVCAEEKRRGAFGIHVDQNRRSSPGSAGCIVTLNTADMQDIVKFLRIHDPKLLKVDWGL